MLKPISNREELGIIEQMQAEISKLKDRIGALENERKIGVVDLPTTPQKPSFTEGLPRVKSPQQRRDEIVERAKADINGGIYELVKSCFGKAYVVKSKCGGLRTMPEFIINKEKRTVAVLMKGVAFGDVYAKGIAKCAPTDCFNVHIGKAIALRRALGLNVPSEYLKAPQPTEVRVGDRIKLSDAGNWTGHIETVGGFNYRGYVITNESPGYLFDKQYEIVDDSRE